MRRAFLFLFVPLLMGSGPCDDAPASSPMDGGAGTSGASGTSGAAGTKGNAGTGGGTSCADRFEPIEGSVALFQGNWMLDAGVGNGECDNAFIVSLEPWSFNAADAPSDPAPVSGCPGVFLTIRPKLLEGTPCTLPAICPTATSASGFFVHPYPKSSAAMPAALAHIIVRADSMSTWQKTDRAAIIDPAKPDHMNLDDHYYTRTGIVSGSCMAP